MAIIESGGTQEPRHWGRTRTHFDRTARRITLADQFQANFDEVNTLFNGSHVIGVSLDLDGVVIEKYHEDGQPYLDGNVTSIARFVRRTRRAVREAGKEFLLTLNTNRELPIVPQVMELLDPNQEQSTWWAVLEGGHALAYRAKFSPEDVNVVSENGEEYESIRLPDGGLARIVKAYDDGSKMVIEELIRTSPEHVSIRIGQNQLTLDEARRRLVKHFEDGISDNAYRSAYIPKGRYGMVTVRNLDESHVLPEGSMSIAGQKHYSVPDDSPVAKQICAKLGIDNMSALPATLHYYPPDRGFDVQFKGLSKQTGQELLFERMRQFGAVGADQRLAVVHIGDSGSDRIAFRSEKLRAVNEVVSVGNAEQGLAQISIAQSPYGFTRGVKHVLYDLQRLAMRTISPHTIERFRNNSVAGEIEGYFGRKDRREGDIDLREVMTRVDVHQLEEIMARILAIKERNGRVFVYGNGGSFDNSRLIANLLRTAGVDTTTPGDNRSYSKSSNDRGYQHIFVDALVSENFGQDDLVIGISGSGNSENVILAHDYAIRTRMQSIQPYLHSLRTMGYIIDVSLQDLPELRDDFAVFDKVAQALEAFETSISQAEEQAREQNDDEALALISKLKQSQNIISLGGRDGGKMKKLTGDRYTHIAPTTCMEALEDVHPLVMAAISEAITAGKSVKDILPKITTRIIDNLAAKEHLRKITTFGLRIEHAIMTGKGRVVIVGNPFLNPATTHAQADWGRGIINMLPIAGPEVTLVGQNINAWMATGNDDGSLYSYIDEFAKLNLGEDDTVVIMGTSPESKAIRLCYDLAIEQDAYTFIVGADLGDTRADIPTKDSDLDLTATSIIHAISRGVNEDIRSEKGKGWNVEEADTSDWPETTQWVRERMKGQKKLSNRDTLRLEEALRNQDPELLPKGKVIVWCYGNPYTADDPRKFGLHRGFY